MTRKTETLALKIDLKASDLLGEGIGDVVTVGLSDDANDEFVWGEDEEDELVLLQLFFIYIIKLIQ